MLSHLKVVEITDQLGAYTGRILAELGADVVKLGAVKADANWRVTNAGKRLIDLDLATDAGLDQLATLIANADILLQGDSDDLAARGLDHARLAASNPRLISVVVAPFAEHGPMAGAPASDLTLMAMSGILNMVGDPEHAPLKLPGAQAYALGGIQAVTGALTALRARQVSGVGQRVWVSAYQSAVLAGYRDPIVWEWTGRIGQRTGNSLVRGKSGVRQIWAAKDGYVTWAFVDNPPMVKGMVALMQADGVAGILADVDWAAILVADAPQEQIDDWEAILAAWISTKPKRWLAEMSAEHALGLSVIDMPAEAATSAHWKSRGFWRRLADPCGGPDLPIPGPLFQSAAVHPADPTPARAWSEEPRS